MNINVYGHILKLLFNNTKLKEDVTFKLNNMNFFELAEKKEQARRHITSVYTFNMCNFISNPFFENSIMNSRDKGYEFIFNQIFCSNNYLSQEQKDLLSYLKNKYNVDDDTFKRIIGLEIITPTHRTPQKYSKLDNFILLIHVASMSLLCGFRQIHQEELILYYKNLLNYLQIQHLIDLLYNYLSNHKSFDDYQTIENKIIKEFNEKYNNIVI